MRYRYLVTNVSSGLFPLSFDQKFPKLLRNFPWKITKTSSFLNEIVWNLFPMCSVMFRGLHWIFFKNMTKFSWVLPLFNVAVIFRKIVLTSGKFHFHCHKFYSKTITNLNVTFESRERSFGCSILFNYFSFYRGQREFGKLYFYTVSKKFYTILYQSSYMFVTALIVSCSELLILVTG